MNIIKNKILTVLKYNKLIPDRYRIYYNLTFLKLSSSSLESHYVHARIQHSYIHLYYSYHNLYVNIIKVLEIKTKIYFVF